MLNGYKRVSSEATKEGQVISSGMVDSFRSNDALFEGILKALLCNPLMASGFDRDQPESGKPLDPYAFINAQLLEINSEVNLDAGIPLIWFARQKIILNAKINANGKGAQPGESGSLLLYELIGSLRSIIGSQCAMRSKYWNISTSGWPCIHCKKMASIDWHIS